MNTRRGTKYLPWLCLVLLCPAFVSAQTTTAPASRPAPFTFAVVTDTHIADADHLARFRQFLLSVQDHRPDFLLILGDLCGQAPEYLSQMQEVVRHSGLKVYCIPGNHDDDYGRRPEWFAPAFGPSHYSFDHKGWRFIMNDSQRADMAGWVDEQLTIAGGAPVVFCQHYPPQGPQAATQAPWPQLGRAGNVRLVLTGHWHRRQSLPVGPITCEVLKNCSFAPGQDESEYYLVDVLADGLTKIRPFPLAELTLREPTDKVPTIKLDAPRTGQALRGRALFAGTAADDRAVQSIELSVDFGPWQPIASQAKWQASFDTRQLPDGHHFFRVRSVDSAGQPATHLPTILALVDNKPQPATATVFRFQQGTNGYDGCHDVTVRRFEEPKSPDGTEGQPTDLECWTFRQGQREFNEFYIRFDLGRSGIPRDARIRRASLTLFASRQNMVDPEGRLCRYYLGVLPEPWTTDMTFATRPRLPAWLVNEQPEPKADLVGIWPGLGSRQAILPPQPVVIDLTPLRQVIQQWLAHPASNHGLVFSPAPGRDYNVSVKGSRCEIVTLRPILQIELQDPATQPVSTTQPAASR